MRRAIVALLGTAAGTTLLVGAKAGLLEKATPAANTATVNAAPGGPGPLAAAPDPGEAGSGPGWGAADTGAVDSGDAAETSRGAGSPGPGSASGPTAARPTPPGPKPGGSAAASGLHDGTFTGAVATVKYGNVQVRITVSGARLTDVTALQLPHADANSVQINQRAAPALRQEALTKQSAVIQAVSGATFTSSGYRTSLQSALDAAKQG